MGNFFLFDLEVGMWGIVNPLSGDSFDDDEKNFHYPTKWSARVGTKLA